jgi:hypothetical protein
MRLSEREQRRIEERERRDATVERMKIETQGEGTSRDMELHRIGSSTSVFRTPSSVASSRVSVLSAR